MPILSRIGRRSWRTRLLLAGMYAVLTLLGITMVVPFLITVASSFSNGFDYDRFLPVPRFAWSRSDRFCRGLVRCFDKYPKWYSQLACALPGTPATWNTWRGAGRDWAGIDTLAARHLTAAGAAPDTTRRAAADYSRFVDQYPLEDLLVPVSDVAASQFLAAHYRELWHAANPGRRSGTREALDLLSARWGMPLPSFHSVGFEVSENVEPYWQQSWFPPENPKYRDYLLLKDLYRHHGFTPGIAARWRAFARARGLPPAAMALPALCTAPDPGVAEPWSEFKAAIAPAAPAVPFALRAVWLSYLESDEARQLAGLPATAALDIAAYNQLAGTAYASLQETPFPVPADAPASLQALWTRFVETRFPVRLTRVEVTPETQALYTAFLAERFRTVVYANRMLETRATGWHDFALSADPPPVTGQGGLRSVWIDFVKNLPAHHRRLRCAEMDYQAWLLARYGSLDAINTAHGLGLTRIEEAFPPFAAAYTVTFQQHEWSFVFRPLLDNYRFIVSYLLGQSRALVVTALLITASVLLTLIVNPMCAYALSRFNLRGKDRIILYLLATMAFPAMISAIPAYLLMRDLGLLNTFFALLLPGAANGMAIFMLKGFFDSLPPELYEAATIDGAKEWQIFLIITLPLMKPILAINALNAFIAAYNGWEWALIICQKKEMWTLSVWMYQANQRWAVDYPWIVTAGFVVVSIPTLLVFLFCQRIILRGIILPQMK